MRLIPFGRRKKAEADGEDAKHYKRANLGEKNTMYYNEELKMWVEKGKEEEARAAKAAAAAPPPAPTMTPVPSTGALNGAADSPGQPPAGPKYARNKTLKDRYIAQPVGGIGGGSGPPSGKGLFPGAPAAGLIPGKPAIPTAATGALVPPVGTFFMPTPTASEAPSEAGDSSTPGTMSLSQSGRSLKSMVPGSGPPSAMGMFVPGYQSAVPATDSTESTAGLPPPTAEADKPVIAESPHATANGVRAERDSSNGGRVPAAGGGGQNLSFGHWHQDDHTGSRRSPRVHPVNPSRGLAAGSDVGAVSFGDWDGPRASSNRSPRTQHDPTSSQENTGPAKQQQYHEQHPRSPKYSLQEQPEQQQPAAYHAEANGNGNHLGYHDHGNGGFVGQNTFAVPAADAEGGPAAAATGGSTSTWGAPASGMLDLSTQVPTAFDGPATPSAWAAADAQGVSAVEGTSWQPAADNLGQPGSAIAEAATGSWGAATWAGTSADAEGGENGDFDSWQPHTTPAGQPGAVTAETAAEWGLTPWAPAAAGALQGDRAAGSNEQPDRSQAEQPGSAFTAAVDGADYWAQGVTAATSPNAANAGVAAGVGDFAGWDQSGDAVQQGHGQYVASYQDVAGQQQWPGYYQQPSAAGQQAFEQPQQPDANGYGYYGQYSGTQQESGADSLASHRAALAVEPQQPLPMMLDPVHPELPGIATAVGSIGSEEFAPSSSHQQQMGSAPAASSRYFDASSSRYQSAPGSAPHPARSTSGGLHSSALGPGLSAGARSNSLQPKSSVSSFLPPPRQSFNGSVGSPPNDSSAVMLPATAVAGDSSLMTTVRPSSPYARPVSPLARTTTGMSDVSSDSKAAAQGFPIPSPPTAGLGKPNLFMPSISNFQPADGTSPWRPSAAEVVAPAVDGTSSWLPSPQHQQQQGQQQDGLITPPLINGYVGPHYATVNGPAVAAADGWKPADNHRAAFTAQDAAGRVKHSKRVHYYDEFLQDTLSEVNWKLHPFEQPGKLNKLTPFEEFEREQERKKQQQQKKSASKRQKAFYLKQMELRQKLPAAAKPSMSEPIFLPSHAAAARGTQSGVDDSTLSNASFITDWQQHRQQIGHQGYGEPSTPQRAKSAAATVHADGSSPGEETTPESKYQPLFAADAEGGNQQSADAGSARQLAPAMAAEGQSQHDNSFGGYDPLHHQLSPEASAANATAPAAQEAGATGEQQDADTAPVAAAWPAEWSLCSPDVQAAWVQYCYPEYLAWVHDQQYQDWFAQMYNASMQQQHEQQGTQQQPAVEQEQQQPEQLAEGQQVVQPQQGVEQQQQQHEEQQPAQERSWGSPDNVAAAGGLVGAADALWSFEGASAAASTADGQVGGIELDSAFDAVAATPAAPAADGAAADAASGAAPSGEPAAAAQVVQQADGNAAAVFDAVADAWVDDSAVFDALGQSTSEAQPELVAQASDAFIEQQAGPTPIEVALPNVTDEHAPGNDPVTSQPTSATAAAAAVAEAVTAATFAAEQLFEEAISHSARASSSTGLASQPSTAKAAAAASKAIVTEALDRIIKEHAAGVVENGDHHAAADAALKAAAVAAAEVAAAVDGLDEAWGDGWGDEGLDLGDIAAAIPATAAAGEVQQAVAPEAAAKVAASAAEEEQTAAGEAEASAAAGSAWGDGWDGDAADATTEAGAEQAAGQYAITRPQDWDNMCKQIEAVPDPDGSLIQYKQGFIQWGDVFFGAAGHLWPVQQQPTDGATAAELAERTAELDQAAEMFSELQLQHRALASIFSNQGFNIEDLLSSLEL